jgi:hypothetical protein
MALELPTEDASDDLWDTLLNDALETIDAHDHSTGKGVTVKTAGISINADLTFGGYAATALKASAFSAVATTAVSALSCALFRNTADDELYWRTSGGVNVKITDGSSLNASLLGGFTGDYGSGAEEAEFSSGTGIYDFRVAATERGYIDCSDIRLFEKTAGVTNAVKLKSPASLAASYTLTFPDALPGSTSLLLVSSTGAITASRNPTIDDLTCDDITCDSVTVTQVDVEQLNTENLNVSGDTEFSGAVGILGGEVDLSATLLLGSGGGVISPTALAANTDNWNPTGLSTALIIRASSSANYNLTGIVAPAAGRTVLLINVGANNIVLKHNATSTSANRLRTPNQVDCTLTPESSCILWYDITSAMWRVLGKST